MTTTEPASPDKAFYDAEAIGIAIFGFANGWPFVDGILYGRKN